MSKIYLIRHGQTLWNQDMRFQGFSDIELSEEGVKQAEALSERLKTFEIAAVYASDLKRAEHTAKALASPHGLSVKTDARLREVNCGEWEGLTGVEIEEKYPGQLKQFFSEPATFAPPGGESLFAVGERCILAFNELAEKHREENIAIVAHGGVIRSILANILVMDKDALWHLRQDNTCLNVIGIYEGRQIVELLNDINHLL